MSNNQISIESYCEDVLSLICTKTDTISLIKLSGCSKKFLQLINQQSFWKQKLLFDFPGSMCEKGNYLECYQFLFSFQINWDLKSSSICQDIDAHINEDMLINFTNLKLGMVPMKDYIFQLVIKYGRNIISNGKEFCLQLNNNAQHFCLWYRRQLLIYIANCLKLEHSYDLCNNDVLMDTFEDYIRDCPCCRIYSNCILKHHYKEPEEDHKYYDDWVKKHNK